MAAVRVVFPWSTWPMVPMLTCGLVRSKLAFATGFLLVVVKRYAVHILDVLLVILHSGNHSLDLRGDRMPEITLRPAPSGGSPRQHSWGPPHSWRRSSYTPHGPGSSTADHRCSRTTPTAGPQP